MTNIMELNEHCRLCLVKDEVNVPIFEDEGDVRQVLLKITACLPVKIAKADSLPKRICDGCLYKLESFYQFWNTSVTSEKQLLQWLSETLNGDAEANLHALKQEPTDNLQTESQVFIQQQLAYQDTENYGEFPEETNYKPKKSTTKKEREREKRERVRERKREEAEEEEEAEEAPAPKRKRRAATKKPAIEIDDDDDDEEYVPPSAAVTKTEDDSEANDDPGDDYGADDNASDDNLDDETEPGPSGTTKSSTDAPYPQVWKRIRTWTVDENSDFRKYRRKYHLKKAIVIMSELSEFSPSKYPRVFTKHGKLAINQETEDGLEVSNIIASTRNKYRCDICSERYQTYIELKYHHAVKHRGDEDGGSSHSYEGDREDYTQTSQDKSAARKITDILNDLICEVCGANFDAIGRYEAHVVLHKKFSCTNCSARFSLANELVTHATEIHGIIYQGLQNKPAKEAEATKEKPSLNHSEAESLKYRCKVCNRRFADCFQLQRHKRMHSKDAKVVEEKQVPKVGCDLCNLEFSLREDMLTHRAEHLKSTTNSMVVDDDDDDDDIEVVNAYRVPKPGEAVINIDSSDSDNELIFNAAPVDEDEPVPVTLPSPKKPKITAVMGSALSIPRKPSEPTKDNTTSSPPQVAATDNADMPDKVAPPMKIRCMNCNYKTANPASMKQHNRQFHNILVSEKDSPPMKIRCTICNFSTANADIMKQHNKQHHSTANTVTATINQSPNQHPSIVTKASSIVTDHVTTTTITTPTSMNVSPSTAWGNQLVIISPSTTGGHPIFILPGNNSSTNTSNVDINIRTSNQPKPALKAPKPKKMVKVPKGTLRNINFTKSDFNAPVSLRQEMPASNSSDNPTLLNQNPPFSKYTINVVNQGQQENIMSNVAPVIPTEEHSSYASVIDQVVRSSLNMEQQNVDVNYDASVGYSSVIQYCTKNQQPSVSKPDTNLQEKKKPMITVKSMASLMKSPLKTNVVDTQPQSVPGPASFRVPATQIAYSPFVQMPQEPTSTMSFVQMMQEPNSTVSFVQMTQEPPATMSFVQKPQEPTTVQTVSLPKLTTVSKAQLISLMSKKPTAIITKATRPTVNVSSSFTPVTTAARPTVTLPTISTKAVVPLATTAAATTTTTTSRIATTSTFILDTENAEPKTPTLVPRNPKTNSTDANDESSSSDEESSLTMERTVHKCEVCLFEARKRSKLHMHCKFKCNHCQFMSCKLNCLDTHYETLHNVRNICCPCNVIFKDTNALLQHKNKVHMCPTCDKCQIDLTKHVNACRCPLCNFTTCKQTALNNHYKTSHNIVRNCAPCNIAFGSVADFEDHKLSMHFCQKCQTYKMNLNVHKTFCKGDDVTILDRVESLENLEVIELD